MNDSSTEGDGNADENADVDADGSESEESTGQDAGDGDGDSAGDGDGDSGDGDSGDGDSGDGDSGDGDTGDACEGTFTITVEAAVDTDDCGHENFINLPSPAMLMFSASGKTLEVSGPGDPWVNASGTFNPADCSGMAMGTGTIAGFPNTPCEFSIVLGPGGTLVSGTYTCGTDNMLPGGCPIIYAITAI